MSHVVHFDNVSTTGLESSPVATALTGLRAIEARYFRNIDPDSLHKFAILVFIQGARKWAQRWVFDRAELRRFKGTYRDLPGRPAGVAAG